jgi:hypothetical protein
MRRFSARSASLCLSLGDLLLVVVAALAGVAELCDGGDVDGMVAFAVPSRVEPMPFLVS